MPVAAWADLRAHLRSGLDQPFGRQNLDRFPDDRPADAESLAQGGFIRQRRPWRHPVAEDKETEVMDDFPVEPTPEVRCPVLHDVRCDQFLDVTFSYYCMMITV
jgi:hypothetical protein